MIIGSNSLSSSVIQNCTIRVDIVITTNWTGGLAGVNSFSSIINSNFITSDKPIKFKYISNEVFSWSLPVIKSIISQQYEIQKTKTPSNNSWIDSGITDTKTFNYEGDYTYRVRPKYNFGYGSWSDNFKTEKKILMFMEIPYLTISIRSSFH